MALTPAQRKKFAAKKGASIDAFFSNAPASTKIGNRPKTASGKALGARKQATKIR